MHHNIRTVSHRVGQFSPKCSEIIWYHKKGQSLNNAIKYTLFSTWKVNCSKSINADKSFNAIHDSDSLQQAQITKLMETMFNASTLWTNNQQQSFRPQANSTID